MDVTCYMGAGGTCAVRLDGVTITRNGAITPMEDVLANDRLARQLLRTSEDGRATIRN